MNRVFAFGICFASGSVRVVMSNLDGINTEPMCVEMSFDAVDHRYTFLGCKECREELHNSRISIQSDKRLTVSDEPPPED
jgi:hypothetical protein